MGATETYVAIGVLLSLLGVVIVMVLARCCRCIKELGRNDVDDDTQDGGTIENLFQRNSLLFFTNLKSLFSAKPRTSVHYQIATKLAY